MPVVLFNCIRGVMRGSVLIPTPVVSGTLFVEVGEQHMDNFGEKIWTKIVLLYKNYMPKKFWQKSYE